MARPRRALAFPFGPYSSSKWQYFNGKRIVVSPFDKAGLELNVYLHIVTTGVILRFAVPWKFGRNIVVDDYT